MSREIEGMWEIRDAEGKVIVTGATEGQAWIEHLGKRELSWPQLNGLSGYFLIGWILGSKSHGYHAVEVR